MFNGFTKQTGDFLLGLMFNNERSWFLEHKSEYEQYLKQPFDALAKETAEIFNKLFPEKAFQLHIARIYRDARRLHGRGPYKDHLWFSLKNWDGLLKGPMFWFEIGAVDYSFGMGFYSATAQQMENFRRSIDENPARFERLAQDIVSLGDFEVFGEEYKRPKGERGGATALWYNRKRVGLECSRSYDDILLSPELPAHIAEKLAPLMPMYEYLSSVFLMQ